MKLLHLLVVGLSVCIVSAVPIKGRREWRYPAGCTRLETCVYYASFLLFDDKIAVTVEANQTDSTYTGVGVTEDANMDSGADLYWGYCEKDGNNVVLNGWLNTTTSRPEKDDVQSLFDDSITCNNGYLKMVFSRYRVSTHPRDLNLTETDCHHIVFPVQGGKVAEDGSGAEALLKPPTISSQPICFSGDLTTETPQDINEPETTILPMTSESPVAVGLCDGRPDGEQHLYPNDCTKYIECTNGAPKIKQCQAYTYFAPTSPGTDKCVDQGSLTPERKAECNLH